MLWVKASGYYAGYEAKQTVQRSAQTAINFLMPVEMLSFLLLVLVMELTPGPNMGYLAVLAASQGRKAGFAAVVGVAIGLLLCGVAAAFGVHALIQKMPTFYQLLRWAGFFYLLWIAWESWRGSEAVPASETTSYVKHVARGILTNLLSPKTFLFYATVLPSLFHSPITSLSEMLWLTCIYVAIATLIHSGIVTLASNAERYIQGAHARRIAAALLVLVAIWLLWTTRAV